MRKGAGWTQRNRRSRPATKRSLVDVSDALAKLGLVCLAITITLVTGLVFGFVLGEGAGMVSIVVAAMAFACVWLILPLAIRARAARSH